MNSTSQAQGASYGPTGPHDLEYDEPWIRVSDVTAGVSASWKTILGGAVLAGAAAYGVCLLLTPIYTAKTTIVSPQQQQNAAAAALSSLGALSGLSGMSGALKNPSDQYISIMESVTLRDRMVDRFKLMEQYKADFRVDARRQLESAVRISAGKSDNLISIEVDDPSPQRAADIANAYVEELRRLTNTLALTEAQQRRLTFEQQLGKTRDALKVAQINLQKTGYTAGALKSEPKSAAEAYARTKAEIASGEVRLQSMRKTLTENAPEIQQQLAALSSLRGQLAQFEQPMDLSGSQDYVSAYREFKYQEALFEIYAKQFELAKMDEAREGILIQVLDPATPPERRSKPKRMAVAATTAVLAGLVLSLFFIIRHRRRDNAAA